MTKRLPFALFSALLLALSAGITTRTLALMQVGALQSLQSLLLADARHLEAELQYLSAELPNVPVGIAHDSVFAGEVRALAEAAAITQDEPDSKPSEELDGTDEPNDEAAAARTAARNQLEEAHTKIADRLRIFRAEHPEIDGLALTDHRGVVLVSVSSAFDEGSNLAAGPTDVAPPPMLPNLVPVIKGGTRTEALL